MSELKEKLSQAAKPRGFWGRIAARLMAYGHRPIYKNVATVLDLQPDDDFLEIGFGSGIFIKKYASHVRSITGLEYSEDMVNLASNYNRKRIEAGTAELRCGDAALLPWREGRFSAVAVIETFYFFPNPMDSLKEINRVLRPGGRLVISVGWNADDGKDHTNYVKKQGIRLYTGKELQAMFQEAGFSESAITYSKLPRMPKLMIACAVK